MENFLPTSTNNFVNNTTFTQPPYTAPEPFNNNEVNEQYERDNFLKNLRIKRDALLAETDWTALPDSPLSEEKKVQYLVYRQVLRNLPQTQTYDTLIWPLRP